VGSEKQSYMDVQSCEEPSDLLEHLLHPLEYLIEESTFSGVATRTADQEGRRS